MTVLEALGFPIDSPKTLQIAKREIKSREEELRSFGIDYDSEDEIFFYMGNSSVGFIPSLFNKKGQAIEALPMTKKSINDLIGEKIEINDKEAEEITSITFETEGAFVCAAYVETKSNRNNFV